MKENQEFANGDSSLRSPLPREPELINEPRYQFKKIPTEAVNGKTNKEANLDVISRNLKSY